MTANDRSGRRILCISRNYPNRVIERLGLWTERLVLACAAHYDFTVVSGVPYSPPIPGMPQYTRFRRVPRRETRSGIDVHYPRFLTGPGSWLYSYEWRPYYAAVRAVSDRLHRERPFDLIHAHFTYPDGLVAARLAQRYGIPFVITEHTDWQQFLEGHPRLKRALVETATRSAAVVAVSESLRRSIVQFTGRAANVVVIPNTVDAAVFKPTLPATERPADRLLFVGIMRHVKGVDVLLRAVRALRDRGRHLRLAVVGEGFYENYRRQHEALATLVHELGIAAHVEFLGDKTPEQVATEMGQSTMLVLPSRRESFGVVLVEALACGIPVVATRCGGPEDIVHDGVGTLVEPDDPEALADGIERILARRAMYDPARLHQQALERYGFASVGRQLMELYNRTTARTNQAAAEFYASKS